VNSAVWSPDGQLIASASSDGTAKVWDASTGHTLLTFYGHGNEVNSAAWSPDSKLIASASSDGTVQVWEMRLWYGADLEDAPLDK
jgi:WD40 repeat protein